MFGEIHKIRALATKYSKQELASLVQTRQIPLQDAALAGMMIDRIAKSAIQPPQTTVAQDVLGTQPEPGQIPPQMAQAPQGAPQMPPPQMAANGGLMGMMPHSDGVAALHSGLHDMAGGGIVAFADGGDVPSFAGDRGSFIDPEFRTKDPKKIKEAQFNILAQELRDQQEAARTSEGEDKQRALSNIEAIQREMRSIKPAPSADAGIGALIPSAQAAEKSVAGKPRAPATKAAAPMPDYYQDPLGAPDYTTEGYSFKQPVEKGKTYEPSLQGLMFGYEQVEPRKELPPITAPKKSTAPNPLNVPRDNQGTPAAPTEEKAPMGPQRPSFTDQLGNMGVETIQAPQEKNIRSIVSEQAEADKAYGADPQKMFDDIRKEYGQTQGSLSERKDKALGMALMMWGIGFAGARQGQEFEMASKSGMNALNMYSSAMDKINDNEDKLKQRLQDLSVSENQYKVSRSDKALAEMQSNKREIRSIELENAKLKNHALIESKKLAVDVFKNQNPALYQTLENIAAEQRAKGNKGYTTLDALQDYQGVSKTGQVSADKAKQEWAKDPMIQSKFPNPDDYVRFVTGTTKPAAGSSKVKFLGYEGQ